MLKVMRKIIGCTEKGVINFKHKAGIGNMWDC